MKFSLIPFLLRPQTLILLTLAFLLLNGRYIQNFLIVRNIFVVFLEMSHKLIDIAGGIIQILTKNPSLILRFPHRLLQHP